MTVVAAFRIGRTPVLISDTLLTANAPASWDRQRPFYPVNPHAASSSVTHYNSGARRKIVKITPEFCVGWSGTAFAAIGLVRHIKAAFSANQPTLAVLKAFLAQREPCGTGGAFHIIGWLREGSDFRCISWNSEWPQDIFEQEQMVVGSGEDVLSRLMAEEVKRGGNIVDEEDIVCFRSLSLIAKCHSQDVFSDTAFKNRFGYFYEVLYWSGSSFEYIKEVTYSFWRMKTDPEGRVVTAPSPLILNYRSEQSHFIAQTIHVADMKVFIDRVDDGTTQSHQMPEVPLRLEAQFLCWYIQVTLPNGTVLSGPIITTSDNTELGWVEQRDGKENLMIRPSAIYELFASQV